MYPISTKESMTVIWNKTQQQHQHKKLQYFATTWSVYISFSFLSVLSLLNIFIIPEAHKFTKQRVE